MIVIASISPLDHNSTYVIHDLPLSNWAEARKICLQLNGDLASINNDEEDRLLSSMPTMWPKTVGSGYWIGLNDVQKKGNFSWSDGSLVSFTKWLTNEPNSSDEDCVAYDRDNGWYDMQCHYKRSFICKLKGIRYVYHFSLHKMKCMYRVLQKMYPVLNLDFDWPIPLMSKSAISYNFGDL